MDVSELEQVLLQIATNVLPLLHDILNQMDEEPERADELREYAHQVIDIAMNGINTALDNIRRQQPQPEQPEQPETKKKRKGKPKEKSIQHKPEEKEELDKELLKEYERVVKEIGQEGKEYLEGEPELEDRNLGDEKTRQEDQADAEITSQDLRYIHLESIKNMDIFPSNRIHYVNCLINEVLPYIMDLYMDRLDGSYVQFQMAAVMEYPNPQNPDEVLYETVIYSSGIYRRKNALILSRNDVPRVYKNLMKELIENIRHKEESKTQFRYVQGRWFRVLFFRYWPFTDAGEGYIETPQWLKRKVINIKNGDSNCFIWSVLRALHPSPYDSQSKPYDLKKYKSELKAWNDSDGLDGNETKSSEAKLSEDDFELTPDIASRITELNQNSRLATANGINSKSIKQFEIANNLKINLFYIGQEEGDIKPIYLSKNPNSVPEERCINLGLLTKVTNDQVLAHYVLIRNLALLFKEGRGYKFCFDCLSILHDDESLKNHKKYCYNDYCDLQLPEGEQYMEFKHHNRSQRYPFCVFIDFEATSIKRTGTAIDEDNDQLIFQEVQLPNSIGIFCPDLNQPPCFIYDADHHELGKKIANKLQEIRQNAVEIMLKNKDVKNTKMSEEEKAQHESITHCEECGVEFGNEKGKYKCRDHDHATGQYRAA